MQSNKAPNAEKLRQAAKACVVLSPLLGMTWAFGISSVTNAGLVFQYIFIALNSLQVTYELLLLVAIVAKHALQVLLRLGHLTTCYLSRLASGSPGLSANGTRQLFFFRNWESCAWPNYFSLQRKAFHLRTDSACQFWQMVIVLCFWC